MEKEDKSNKALLDLCYYDNLSEILRILREHKRKKKDKKGKKDGGDDIYPLHPGTDISRICLCPTFPEHNAPIKGAKCENVVIEFDDDVNFSWNVSPG